MLFFLSIIIASLTYNIKHVETTVVDIQRYINNLSIRLLPTSFQCCESQLLQLLLRGGGGGVGGGRCLCAAVLCEVVSQLEKVKTTLLKMVI